jgi:hypothetical protein
MDQGLAVLAAWAEWFVLVGILVYFVAFRRR